MHQLRWDESEMDDSKGVKLSVRLCVSWGGSFSQKIESANPAQQS